MVSKSVLGGKGVKLCNMKVGLDDHVWDGYGGRVDCYDPDLSIRND